MLVLHILLIHFFFINVYGLFLPSVVHMRNRKFYYSPHSNLLHPLEPDELDGVDTIDDPPLSTKKLQPGTCTGDFEKVNGKLDPSFSLSLSNPIDFRELQSEPKNIEQLFQQLHKMVAILESEQALNASQVPFDTNYFVLNYDVYFAASFLQRYAKEFNKKPIEHIIDISFDPYYEKFKVILKVLAPQNCEVLRERKEKLLQVLPMHLNFSPSFFTQFSGFFEDVKKVLQKARNFRGFQSHIIRECMKGGSEKTWNHNINTAVVRLQRFFLATFNPIREYDAKNYTHYGSIPLRNFFAMVTDGVKEAYKAQLINRANSNNELNFVSLICTTDFWYYYLYIPLGGLKKPTITRQKIGDKKPERKSA